MEICEDLNKHNVEVSVSTIRRRLRESGSKYVHNYQSFC